MNVTIPAMVLFFSSCSRVNYYLYRANLALENTRTDKAEKWYLKALKKDSLNFLANCEYGLMLGEWMNLHEKALPYLERAYMRMTRDTNWNLMHGLAKAYQHQERYRDALRILSFMNQMKTWDSEDKNELIRDIEKRKSDCVWALAHEKDTLTQYVSVNIGGRINTDKPEYVPILAANGELFFTSKRKDADREKFSLLDGKYHEAIYYTQPGTGQVNRYVIPENNRRKLLKNNYHESMVSLSNNKKVYFYFQKGQLYEVHADSLKTNVPRKLSKMVNFEYYHNHAFLTSDGKTLYFTSDAEGGLGGLDIYRAEKQVDGTWGKAVHLGKEINTPFDEDAPYFDEKNQILYFSSKGHPGFGNYDVYASQLQDGKFLPPVNMGRPVNSGGNDIFYTLTPYAFALHSSSRKGGYGDMDIYKIWNVSDWETIPCRTITVPYSENRISSTLSEVELNLPFVVQRYVWKTEGKISEQFPGKVKVEWDLSGTQRTLHWKGLILDDTSRYLIPLCVNIQLAHDVASNELPSLPKDEKGTDGWMSGEKLESLTRIVRPDVFFEFDSYKLPAPEKDKLKKLSAWIKSNGYQVRIEAYADDRGSDSYNIVLSEKRASAIRNFLQGEGVPASDIIEVIGKGKFPLKQTEYREQRVGVISIRKK